jgi:branched-chain amino acid transport system substrate-binding protein
MRSGKLWWTGLILAITGSLALGLAAGWTAPRKEAILMGVAFALSGPLAPITNATIGPVYDMWVKEVNARGGIRVSEFGRRLPIRFIKYDDKSDLGTATRLLEKLILEDRVDIVFPPISTGFLYAAAPIANKYRKVLIGGPGGAAKLEEIMPNLPYFFQVLNYSRSQMPVLAAVLRELGLRTVAIIHHEDLHGVEYKDVALPEFRKAGLQVAFVKSFPMDIKDTTPLLKEATAARVDALIAFAYPDQGFLLTRQAMELDANFKAMFISVGVNLSAFRDAFGVDVVEGMMGGGAWNVKSGRGARRFVELYKKHFNTEPPDWWGQLYYYASLEHLQQAIEAAGTLDNTRIRDVLATETFNTVVGPFKYDRDRQFRGHLGQIGQWQKGIFEVVDPGRNRTAKPILKPAWPKKR